MTRPFDRQRTMERQVRDRLRRLERTIGLELERMRLDAGASKARVASIAGVDRTYLGRVETGQAHPSLETLTAIATALGGEVSVRAFAGTGPRLGDRHQARMLEALIGRLAPVWAAHLEVPVWRPARGVVDGVFERTDPPLLVVGECMSTLPRLEQQLRWSAQKAESIGSSALVGDRPSPPVSRLLILRSTASTRDLARTFERSLRAAYPSRTADAVDSLTTGSPWPGDSIVWMRIDGERVDLSDGPPRGVLVGR
jgi:transcriptional regulator with XRE-family HTH domain